MALSRLTVRSRLYLLLAFVNALLVLALAYAWSALRQADIQLNEALSMRDQFAIAASDIHRAEVEFKMELLHMKNVLLRGTDKELLKRHAEGNIESGRKFDAFLTRALERSTPLAIPTESIS